MLRMMRGWLCVWVLGVATIACKFPEPPSDSFPDGGGGGAGGGGAGPGEEPEPQRCVFTYVDVCALVAGPALDYTSNTTIDTSVDTNCPHLIAQGIDRPEICLLYASSIAIAANVTVRAVGSRPIAFVSSGDININGILNASGACARNGAGGQDLPELVGAGGGTVECADFVQAPDNNATGGGGGAGGSLSGKGGNGGNGQAGGGQAGGGDAPNAVPATELTYLRGGCRGQTGALDDETNGEAGASGPPGGGIYLAAHGEITITATSGRVAANGGGGTGGEQTTNGAGGGGGGSGGVIFLEGKLTHRNGVIVANGGGGGQGGYNFRISAATSDRRDGADGADGEMDGSVARGGSATLSATAFGGDGSDASQRNGRNGTNGTTSPGAGGGGGGGGAGFIRILGPSDGSGPLSPPLTP